MSLRPNTPLPTHLRRLVATVIALNLLVALPGHVSATPATYHVDCAAGSDGASGLLPTSAWQTLGRVNKATLHPGDRLLLKRGCTWTGPLDARWSGTTAAPITIGAYGSGALPRIQNGHENVKISGSHLVIEHIWTRSDAPGRDAGCENQPLGWRVGFRFMRGASYSTVRHSRADEQYIGILIEPGAHHNKVLDNTLRNNNMRDPDLSSGAGAVGIALMGDDNDIGYNDIAGSDACSKAYGRDGAAIEVYGGSRNMIHHNIATQNINFTELGKPPSADNTYAYNRVTSSLKTANFLVTRGSGDEYGPVYRTKVYNNTVYLSGSESYALQCYGGCSPDILTFRNNIVWAEDRVGFADKPFDESNNIYWRSDGAPLVYFPISSTSLKADPKFMDLASQDLHLGSSSPGVDASSTVAHALGFRRDLDGVAIPQAAGPDIGSYERRSVAEPVAPTTTVPRVSISSPASLGSSTVRLKVAWAGGQGLGAELERYSVMTQINDGSWRTASLASPTSTTTSTPVPLESTVRVRVRAIDRAGTVGGWSVTAPVKAAGYGESTSLATYAGSWRTGSAVGAWRGRYRYSTSAGAAVSFGFVGRSVGVVATTGPTLGRARVYLDGAYVRTIDLRASVTRYRQVVFATNVPAGRHTLKVVVLRTAGHTRVDVDGFVVLR